MVVVKRTPCTNMCYIGLENVKMDCSNAHGTRKQKQKSRLY